MIGIPQFGLARDGCYRAIGCDNMSEDGSIIIAGQGINDVMPGDHPPKDPFLSNDPAVSALNIPPAPTKRGNGRMTIRKFETVVNITSPTSAKTRIVANLNPNIAFLSQGIIDFALKHLAGVVLAKLQSAAKKVVKNPATNHHAQQMREEPDFYQTWLMAKFKAFCDEKGWEMPRVSAFTVNEEQLAHNRRYTDRKTRKLNTFGGHDSFVSDRVDQASVQSACNMKAEKSDDSVSEITAKTSVSMWQNNPVSNYMQAVKVRKTQEKESKIAQVRQRVTDMMKPKMLSFEQQDRLEELRLAKQRRMEGMGLFSRDNSAATGTAPGAASSTSLSVSQHHPFRKKINLQLYEHGKWTRISVMTVFIALLFVLLHPSLLAITFLDDSLSRGGHETTSEWTRDFYTILYIALCTLLHCCLCDVCLVYTFSSLELGSKTGQQIRSFYGTNVRIGALVLSVGIAVFSVVKASLRALLFISFRTATQLPSLAQTTARSSLNKIEIFLSGTDREVAGFALLMLRWLRRTLSFSWERFDAFLVRIPISDAKLGLLGEIVETIHDTALYPFTVAARFLSYGSMNNRSWNMHMGWRHNIFSTAKDLFSYSAVFLVTVVLLFLLTAPRTRQGGSCKVLSIDKDANALEGSQVLVTASDSGSSGIIKVNQLNSVPSSVGVFENEGEGRQ
ncbi:hypothetical protein FisN_9Lh178 [Fistulifera solaris]|uniref:Uncharacterized protein n=1 Tax=Fistulifera solaris TaxID=1519565 RepID=A0A1Z5KKN9_FISSO|nr:hypothetical protein FisN_9Lh178 [Fistulifera solaris]|eukprot:GAX26884.1 hypothetical protein FisN_9Lh178 [Fistulifera solaris]